MKHCFTFLLISFLASWFTSCGNTEEENEAQKVAEGFCEEFLNFNYDKALPYCAKGEEGWLRMYISNITKADEDSIRNLTSRADYDVDDVNCDDNDSLATVLVNIHSAYMMEDISRHGHMVNDGTYQITMIKDSANQWKIRRGVLRRSGM